MSRPQDPELVLGITPFEEPNAALAVALARAGSVGVLDLGRDHDRAQAALAQVCRWWSGQFGVRLPTGCPLSPADLPDQVDVIVLGSDSPWPAAPRRRILVEVSSVAQAHTAVQAGACGLIAKGAEAGGRVGATTTFVLLQQLLADSAIDIPIWAAGGIGPHTAAAAIAGGAAGVVLDAQLALVVEADLPPQVAAAIRAMDGTETAVIGGHRRSSHLHATGTARCGPRIRRFSARRPASGRAAHRPRRCPGRPVGQPVRHRWRHRDGRPRGNHRGITHRCCAFRARPATPSCARTHDSRQ